MAASYQGGLIMLDATDLQNIRDIIREELAGKPDKKPKSSKDPKSDKK